MTTNSIANPMVSDAIKWFWQYRDQAAAAQVAAGKKDQGERSAVTSGKHMDGFLKYVSYIATSAGLPSASVITDRNRVVLPGYMRPSKRWDVVILHNGVLLAVMELKSHIGPSFGNNFNNRTEEAIGSASDFQLACQNGVIKGPKPFLGYLMLLEDCEGSTKARRSDRTIVPAGTGAFQNASSFEQRYDILCQRLVSAKLYDAATLLLSSRNSGTYRESPSSTSLTLFANNLQKHLRGAGGSKA